MNEPWYITAGELAPLSPQTLPDQLRSDRHLVYSSPATLAFNSPGAQGFGVKRAGLAVPESVMLLVAPRCCGRNTAALGHEQALADRFYYLLQDETDIVTGRHLNHIAEAAREICRIRPQPPSAIMLCITCVDALLGTDMERVCRQAAAAAGVPVVPCYMYALTREGRLPPMAAVREAVYSLLNPAPRRDSRTVNLLGYFSPLDPQSDLMGFLRAAGLTRINQLATCRTFAEYSGMSQANFNLVLNAEAHHAARKLQQRLGIPAIETARYYQPEKTARQYQLIAEAIGARDATAAFIADELAQTQTMFARFRNNYGALSFSIGEWSNADPFELALAFLRQGFRVKEIFGTVGTGNFPFIRKIAQLSPDTRVYSNLSPSMLYYRDNGGEAADLFIGRDAAYYHPGRPAVEWIQETVPFGFSAIRSLIASLEQKLR